MGQYERPEFTMEQSIAYQDQHLAFWKKLLNDRIYSQLHNAVKASNVGRTDPYKIARGTSLDSWLLNYGNSYNPL